MSRQRTRERSQAMTEFALVAPVLLLLTFGIIDFGRALYLYSAAGTAGREAAQALVRASSPLPTDSTATQTASVHFPGGIFSAPSPNCPGKFATARAPSPARETRALPDYAVPLPSPAPN